MQNFINAVQDYGELLQDEKDRQEFTNEIKRICREEGIDHNPEGDLLDVLSSIVPLLTGAGVGTLLFKFGSLGAKFFAHQAKVNDVFASRNLAIKSNTSSFLTVTGLLLGKKDGVKAVNDVIEEMRPHEDSYSSDADHSGAIEQLLSGVIKSRFPNVFNAVETFKTIQSLKLNK